MTVSEIDFELEQRKRERERKAFSEKLKSKRFRMENLYQIVDKTGRAIHFKFNDEQREIYERCFDESGNLVLNPDVLKSRQIGVSTLFVIAYLDDALHVPNLNCYIQTHKDDSNEKVFRIVRFAYDHLPEDCKPALGKGGGSKYELYFPHNNSRIYVGLENRSNALHRVHFSEMAFQEKSKVAATLGALPIWQKYSTETTPNGMNWYREDWVNKPKDLKFFFPWFTHRANVVLNVNTGPYTEKEKELIKAYKLSREQIEFRRAKIASFPGKDVRLFLQEFPEDEQTCFMLSGTPVVSLEAIQRLEQNVIDPIEEINGIKIFRRIQKGMLYVCGADTSEGFSNDYSCAKVFDSNRRECATFRGKIRPSDFAHKIEELCDLYTFSDGRKPLLAVERNNHGHAVLLELEEHIDYPNLFYFKEDRAGWNTDRVTRPIMISALLDAIENETVSFFDQEFVNECLTLVDNNGKIEAVSGQNDDCVLASAISIQMLAEVCSRSDYSNPKEYVLM